MNVKAELADAPRGWPQAGVALTVGGYAGAAGAGVLTLTYFFAFLGTRLTPATYPLVTAGLFAFFGVAVAGVVVGTIGVIYGALTARARKGRIESLERQRRELEPTLLLRF